MRKVIVSLLEILLILATLSCSEKEDSTENMKVGLIVSAAGTNDNGYNEFAIVGLQEAEKRFDITTKVVDNSDDVPGALAALAEDGFKLIFSLEYNFDALINNDGSGKSIAEQFPSTNFVIFNALANTSADGSKIHPNVIEVLFNVNEGSFLAGALAALISENSSVLFNGGDYRFSNVNESRAVGFVGGTASDGIRVFGDGFIAGVNYAAREMGVTYGYYSNYAAGFGSSPANAQIIASFYDAGANVVFAAAGSVAVDMRNEAKKAGRLGIDVDANQDSTVPGTILTSVLKNTDVPVLDIIQKVVSGDESTILGSEIFYSMESGATGITDLSVIESYMADSDEAQKTWQEIENNISDLQVAISNGSVDVIDAQAGEEIDWESLENVIKKN